MRIARKRRLYDITRTPIAVGTKKCKFFTISFQIHAYISLNLLRKIDIIRDANAQFISIKYNIILVTKNFYNIKILY